MRGLLDSREIGMAQEGLLARHKYRRVLYRACREAPIVYRVTKSAGKRGLSVNLHPGELL